MDIFKLAELELIREKKINHKNRINLLFDRAETILKYLSHADRKKQTFCDKEPVKIGNR